MAKWSGIIGFAVTSEQPEGSGVWVDSILEKTYRGDIVTTSRRFRMISESNPDYICSDQISLVADMFLMDNIGRLAYIVYNNLKYRIAQYSIESPRITISLGDIYVSNNEVII